MLVFVSGGNGFIGSVVVKKLVEKGHRVRCLLRATSDISRIQGLPFEKSTGDITNRDSVLSAVNGCDAVIHLASLSNWNDIYSPRMHDVVVGGSKNVIEAAQEYGQLPMVFVSSITAIDGTEEPKILNEESPYNLNSSDFIYSHAKRTVESYCIRAAKQGLRAVIVNPAEVYGPFDTALNTAGNLIDMAKSSPVFVCSGGTSIVHVDDVAEGIVAALFKGRPGSRYILGGDNLTISDLARLSLSILGQKGKRILKIPNGLLRTASRIADKFNLPFPINPKVVPYATRYWFMSNQKAKEELGLSFRSASETLEPTFAWLKSSKILS